MSYKSVILSDHPIAYYPLDDLTTVDSVLDFTDLLAQYNTYQEVLDAFDSYANMYGDIAYDYSGCGNDGNYIGDPASNVLPIVVGNSRATTITSLNSVTYTISKDYYGTSTTANFAIANNSDEPFDIEAWVYPKISTSTVTPIVADSSADVGLFYDKGNIVFKVQSQEIFYPIKNPDKAIHVLGSFSGESISLYIDGLKVDTKSFTEFSFTNSSLALASGPTNSTDSFLINSVAVYRYNLSEESIYNHYLAAIGLDPSEIVKSNNGEFFAISDTTPSVPFRYSYPGNKSWEYFSDANLTYNNLENSLSVTKTSSAGSQSIELIDFISFPISAVMDSSKIEWTATKGITVFTSFDGSTYTECTNGATIPGYNLNSFSSNSGFYIKIVFTSSDTTKYLPKIYDLSMTFYNDQIIYSNNGSSYFSTLEGVFGAVNFDATVPNQYSPVLFRGGRNGVKTIHNSAFHITTSYGVRTIEFFYTPDNFDDDGGLISTTDGNGYSVSNYYWNNTGGITKTSFSALYVNGVNKYSETNINNVFEPGNMYHVVVVFPANVGGDLEFNHSQNGSNAALFQNIALYENAFTQADVTANYNMYRLGNYSIIEDNPNGSSLTVVENSVNYYNNDWVVYQTQ